MNKQIQAIRKEIKAKMSAKPPQKEGEFTGTFTARPIAERPGLDLTRASGVQSATPTPYPAPSPCCLEPQPHAAC